MSQQQLQEQQQLIRAGAAGGFIRVQIPVCKIEVELSRSRSSSTGKQGESHDDQPMGAVKIEFCL